MINLESRKVVLLQLGFSCCGIMQSGLTIISPRLTGWLLQSLCQRFVRCVTVQTANRKRKSSPFRQLGPPSTVTSNLPAPGNKLTRRTTSSGSITEPAAEDRRDVREHQTHRVARSSAADF